MKFPEGFYGLLHVISSCGVYPSYLESGSSHKMKFPEGFYGLLHVISSCGVYHPAIWKVDQVTR